MERAQDGGEAGDPVESVQHIVDENLERVESQLDATMDSAKTLVHDIREESQRMVDRAVDRFRESWSQTQRRIESQVAEHPWLVLGGLLIVGLLVSQSRRRSR